MDYPLLIPGIAQKINSVLKRLNLKPKITPEQFIEKRQGKKHRYPSVCLSSERKKIIFYARLHKKFSEKERMRTEVKIARVLLKEPLFPYFPKYLATGIEKDFEWLSREYFPPTVMEAKTCIQKLKRPLTEQEIAKIAKATFEMGQLPIEKFPFLKKFSPKKYLFSEALKSLFQKKVLSRDEVEKFKELLERNKKIFAKENKYFCHGDFQIGNLIIFNKRLVIIDLESAHINNFAYDIAFLTTHLWQDLATRKKLIENYFSLLPPKKRGIFTSLFSIVSFFVGYHSFRSQPREFTAAKIEERKCFYQKFLKATIKGFETLLRL